MVMVHSMKSYNSIFYLYLLKYEYASELCPQDRSSYPLFYLPREHRIPPPNQWPNSGLCRREGSRYPLFWTLSTRRGPAQTRARSKGPRTKAPALISYDGIKAKGRAATAYSILCNHSQQETLHRTWPVTVDGGYTANAAARQTTELRNWLIADPHSIDLNFIVYSCMAGPADG